MSFMNKCAVDGCPNILGPTNTSGVCRLHNHCDVCGCPACRQRRESGLAGTSAKRIVEVAYPTGNSGVGGIARVSLPREPWL
ncbi:hypothetical protein [Actibacterium sp. MT2.3-13A]|uniref:hypothetical protein n=1 Tax=Actibacterium sp. MT2.3-13A TaxID=2828332 RepID=UPI001BA73A55|nr:hypothetical protein [Actibacterium sp. MT2.3-13A]